MTKACGIDLGVCERHDCVHFTCPQCGAMHDRGFIGGPDGHGGGHFRCLRCGYLGHGIHPDHDTDREVYQEWAGSNVLVREHGIPVTPFIFPDPLNVPG